MLHVQAIPKFHPVIRPRRRNRMYRLTFLRTRHPSPPPNHPWKYRQGNPLKSRQGIQTRAETDLVARSCGRDLLMVFELWRLPFD